MSNSYLTIKKTGNATITIKKSDFICSLARTKDEDTARKFITDVKANYPKANHNCFAYVIGQHNEIQRESDNGEPARTAGIPILEVLKKNELRNTTAVVTRFFGGIKLGTGGLIRTYTQATVTALETIGIVQCTLQKVIYVKVTYSQHKTLKNFLEKNNILLIDTAFTEAVTIQVAVESVQVEAFEKAIIDLLSARVSFEEGPERYIEHDYHLHSKN
ncbi:YigZ family protein [Liquorilactobacillus capillatus]|uniref:YigZ family protein n=1 Tax=Liquorilactobacillus capillatus DSM 19910 TaxID=1423731 RepID=A0A0R1M490_9LACO|nr:YigZ family protein [Liquorilactobacillus capillatus]KRL02893.1 hypothetical protein FC81_GL000383 [Liquorilactobacillus capillatus DSM 19910]